MDTVYINTFDTVITALPEAADCPPAASKRGSVLAAIPDLDSGLWVPFLIPVLTGVKLKLGAMLAGTSASALGSIYYVPPHTTVTGPGVPKKLQIVPPGLQVTVCQNPKVNAVPQSQTLYLVPGDAKDVLTQSTLIAVSPFVGPGTLTAELTFDSPGVSGGVGDAWAVALNFKQNGQSDGGLADFAFGPTCQFLDVNPGVVGVRLHMVDTPSKPYSGNSGTYQDYQNMTFTLTMTMSVDEAGNVSGNASLSIGQMPPFTSTVRPPAGFDLQAVNAVGVAVVSSKNSYQWVRAMLRKFTLSATRDSLFPPIHPPHPSPRR
jgi:hypothetical protein